MNSQNPPVILASLRRIVAAVRFVFTTFVVLCFAFMCVSVGFQVFARYLFNFQLGDATELATFAQVWLALAGCGVAMRYGTIFAIDSLPALLPLNLARGVKIFIALVSCAFLAVMVFGGIQLLEIGSRQTSPTMQIPMWIIYLVIPIAMVYFAFEVILDVIENWDNPFRRIVDVDEPVEDAQ